MARLSAEEQAQQRVIGTRVAEIRERLRLTQPVVADRVGVSLRAYQNWEAGATRIAWSNLSRLATILGVSEDAILHGEDEEENDEPAVLPTGLQAELTGIHERLDQLDGKLDAILKVLEDAALAELREALTSFPPAASLAARDKPGRKRATG